MARITLSYEAWKLFEEEMLRLHEEIDRRYGRIKEIIWRKRIHYNIDCRNDPSLCRLHDDEIFQLLIDKRIPESKIWEILLSIR